MEKIRKLPYLWLKRDGEKLELSELFDSEIDNILDILNTCGAILFRNFGIDSNSKLRECISKFPGSPLDYVEGNSPRTKVKDKIYTSTEHPSDFFISLHNELSYANKWPRFIFFSCEIPALKGGSTVIADSRKIYNSLSKDLIKEFNDKGVKYIRNLHGGTGAGVSWQSTFETEDKKHVEEYCKLNDTNFEWRGNNLRLIQDRQAIIKHPISNDLVWFNQADQFHPSTNPPEVFEALTEFYGHDFFEMPQYACFGDGSEIPLEMLNEIREITESHTIYFTWERGDLMIVDNIMVAHGRAPFKGERKILVSMLS